MFRLSAWEALANLLAGSAGTLLLVPPDDADTLVALNVGILTGALDVASSEVLRFPSGRIMEIQTPVFVTGAVGTTPMFRLAELPFGPTFVCEAFVELVATFGLSGLTLRDVTKP